MRFSILHELQPPRPAQGGDAQRLLQQALEQAELADRLGYHALRVPERHFEEGRSSASAPAVFLAAAAARTNTIRLGWGPVPLAVHHPALIAESLSTLDLLSGGRAELCAGEPDAGATLSAFGIARGEQRALWRERLGAVARMMVETPFSGTDGDELLRMPPRELVPKPVQTPHPPLWLGGAGRAIARVAGENGLGAFVTVPVDPDDVQPWIAEHAEALNDAVPLGVVVEARFALALPMMVHADEAEAIARGLDGAHFDAYARGHFEAFGRHRPGRTALWDEFEARRDDVGLARSAVVADGAPLSVKVLRGGLGSLRGAIGTPDQVRDMVARYAEAGVDELVLRVATGGTEHDDVLAALELFAHEVMPAFAAEEPPHEAPARRAPVPSSNDDYAFTADEDGGSMGDPERSETSEGDGGIAAIRKRLEAQGERAFQAFVRRSDDGRLARTAGSGPGLRVIFATMERQFVPERAGGFTGDIRYDLRAPDGSVRSWTVTVGGTPLRAWARASAPSDGAPKLTIRLAVADFIRIAGRDLDPVQAVLTGRMELEGDFGVALKLGEMFGQPPAF